MVREFDAEAPRSGDESLEGAGGEVRTGQPEVLDPANVGYALTEVLDASKLWPPDRLPDLARRVAAASGARAVRIYLADHGQRRLLPFADPTVEGFDIDGTMGGRAFANDETVETSHDDHVTLWVPLRDGVDRIGVVQFEVDEIDDTRRGTLARVAAVMAAEVVSKGQYTDLVHLARRDEPMSVAAELHHALMPPATFSTDRISVAAHVEPAYAIAGDAFDYAYNEGALHAAVFDAIGHNFNATVVAAVTVAAYRHGRRKGDTLSEIAAAIDSVVDTQFHDTVFSTAVLATVDVRTGEFSWLNCGHPPPLLIRRGHVVGQLGGPHRHPLGIGLGSRPDRDLTVGSLSLEPDDRIVLYTDGIVEARSPTGEDFGLDRLQDFVHRAIASETPDAEMTRRLSHAVVDHHQGRLNDDATLLMICWHPTR